MIDGGVECGPNAVFALSRVGYRWTEISPKDLWDACSFVGFQRLAAKHWRMELERCVAPSVNVPSFTLFSI